MPWGDPVGVGLTVAVRVTELPSTALPDDELRVVVVAASVVVGANARPAKSEVPGAVASRLVLAEEVIVALKRLVSVRL